MVPGRVGCVRRPPDRGAAGEEESDRVSDNKGRPSQTQSPASISKTAALSSADRRVEKIAEPVELSVTRGKPVRTVAANSHDNIPTRTQQRSKPTVHILTTGDSSGDEVVCSITEVGRARIPGNTVSRRIRTRIVQGTGAIVVGCNRCVQGVPGTDALQVIVGWSAGRVLTNTTSNWSGRASSVKR